MNRILTQIFSILVKDVTLEYSYRLQFLLTISGVFFQLATFYFVAKFVGPLSNRLLEPYGGDYFSFLAIGIAFGSYQWISLQTFSQSLREQQVMGTLEMILASPVHPLTLMTGSSLWSYIFATIEVVLYLVLGSLVFGLKLGNANVFSIVVSIAFTILAMSAFGLLSACFIIVFKRGDPIGWAFATVSELLGGVYYSTQILPAPLKFLSEFLPITHALRAVRGAALAGKTVPDLWPHLMILGLFALILLPISIVLFNISLNVARREGTLTQY